MKGLLNDPVLLLLDEPTASLDPAMGDQVRRVLKKIQLERGVSLLYTSHNMTEIRDMCDRICFIHKGELIAEGDHDTILEQYGSNNLEEFFIKVAGRGV